VCRCGDRDRCAGQRADDVPPPAAAGVAAQQKALHAGEQAPERVQRARASYQEEVAALDPQRFQCSDASGINLALTRRYGRAPKGERVIGAVPQHDGAHVTMLAALGSHGVEAVMTVEGATEAEVFRAHVEQVLRPTLQPGDLVMMDHRRAHKAAGIREAVGQAGAQLLYLPPYSPDLSPIERCWAKLETYLRKAKARTREALDTAIAEALLTVTATDAHGWFTCSGYALRWYENRSKSPRTAPARKR
jgi:transposase